MTYEEKAALVRAISKLDSKGFGKVVLILRENMPWLGVGSSDSDDIEAAI